jgi:hypothetical protein
VFGSSLWACIPERRKPKVNHRRTDIAVLEFNGPVGSVVELGLKLPSMLGLAVCLPRQFHSEHLQVVGNNSLYFFP